MMLLMFAVVLSITFVGLFDAARPVIQKTVENTEKLSAGLLEIRDALNVLWIKSAIPAVPSMSLEEFSKYTGRDFSLSYLDGIKKVSFEFLPYDGGTNVVVKCTLHDHVRVSPEKLSGATVSGNEVSMSVQYRRGNIL